MDTGVTNIILINKFITNYELGTGVREVQRIRCRFAKVIYQGKRSHTSYRIAFYCKIFVGGYLERGDRASVVFVCSIGGIGSEVVVARIADTETCRQLC